MLSHIPSLFIYSTKLRLLNTLYLNKFHLRRISCPTDLYSSRKRMVESKSKIQLSNWEAPNNASQDALYLNNNLTRRKDKFIPMQPGLITWYSCGPTVYDSSHMGHARTYLSLDILRRILTSYFGYNIQYVVNITDVDDKIIKRGRCKHLFTQYLNELGNEMKITFRNDVIESLKLTEESLNKEVDLDKKAMLKKLVESLKKEIDKLQELVKMEEECKLTELQEIAKIIETPLSELLDKRHGSNVTEHDIFAKLSRHYENEYYEDMQALGVQPPDVVTRVSEYVPEIVKFVEKLIEKGYAYESNGSIYFEANKFDKTDGHFYAKLRPEAKGDLMKLLEGEGELTQTGESEKKSPQDFAVWKASKPGEPFWESPWGKGRPGWHIECSVMASEILGDKMDIHAGGVDLQFPHHDNEMAQTEAYYDKPQWINYFIHTGHLTIDGCKMSKSLKNFITIKEALNKHTARQLRLFCLIHAWDSVLDYSDNALTEAKQYEKAFQEFFPALKDRLFKLNSALNVKWGGEELELQKYFSEHQIKIHQSFCDSINTPVVIRTMKDIMSSAYIYMEKCEKSRKQMDPVLLRRIGSYLMELLRIFGVVETEPETFNFGFTNENNSSTNNKEEIIMPAIHILANFREKVRKIARGCNNNDILRLCDEVRDQDLVEIGVKLEDKGDEERNWIAKLVGKDAILKERGRKLKEVDEKKNMAEAQKKQAAEEQAKKVAQNKIPPQELFFTGEYAGMYSAYDNRGFPTHDNNGVLITDSQRKKLLKVYEAQQKKYEKFKHEQNTKLVNTSEII